MVKYKIYILNRSNDHNNSNSNNNFREYSKMEFQILNHLIHIE